MKEFGHAKSPKNAIVTLCFVFQAVTKKQGISGQSVDPDKAKAIAESRPRIEKDFRSKQLIREAIMENDFLKHLAPSQVREIVDYMEKKKVRAKSWI